MNPKWIVAAGFLLGVVGLFVVLLLNDRILGFYTFLAGFLVASLGAIWGIFRIPASEKTGVVIPSLKLASIGFGIAVVGGVLQLFHSGQVSKVFFAAGFIIISIGVVIAFIKLLKKG